MRDATLHSQPSDKSAAALERTKSSWLLFFILGIIFVSRSLLIFFVKNPYLEDSNLYLILEGFIRRDGLFYLDPIIHPYIQVRTPLYPLLLIGINKLGSLSGLDSSRLACLINVLFFTGSLFFLHEIARPWIGKRNALLAIILAGITPSTLPYSIALMPESMAIFFFLAGWLALAGGISTSLKKATLSGCFFALATLTKPIFLWSELFPLLILLIGALKKRSLGKMALVQVFGFLLVCSPLFYRNWILWETLTVSPQAGIAFWDFERPPFWRELGKDTTDGFSTALGSFTDPRIPTSAEAVKAQLGFDWNNLAKRSAYLGKLSLQDFYEHKVTFFIRWARAYPRLYFGTGTGALAALIGKEVTLDARQLLISLQNPWGWVQILSAVVEYSLYGLALTGLLFSWRSLPIPFLFATLGSAFYFSIAIVTLTHTRYRFPMLPALVMFAAIGINVIRKHLTTKSVARFSSSHPA